MCSRLSRVRHFHFAAAMAACKLGLSFSLTPVVCFCFGWRDVADGLQQPVVVEPTDPFQCGQFDRLECLPRPTSMNQLGPVQPVDRLGRAGNCNSSCKPFCLI